MDDYYLSGLVNAEANWRETLVAPKYKDEGVIVGYVGVMLTVDVMRNTLLNRRIDFM